LKDGNPDFGLPGEKNGFMMLRTGGHGAKLPAKLAAKQGWLRGSLFDLHFNPWANCRSTKKGDLTWGSAVDCHGFRSRF
jgi:hypothetical protein